MGPVPATKLAGLVPEQEEAGAQPVLLEPRLGAVRAGEDHLQELPDELAPPQARRHGQPEDALADLQE
eukprot:12414560-Alexandrium_andersonii.AAC.1